MVDLLGSVELLLRMLTISGPQHCTENRAGIYRRGAAPLACILRTAPGFLRATVLSKSLPTQRLKQPVGHQDIASAAAVVLAHAHLLLPDRHDAVAGDLAANPLLAVALWTRRQLTIDLAVAGAEAALGFGVS